MRTHRSSLSVDAGSSRACGSVPRPGPRPGVWADRAPRLLFGLLLPFALLPQTARGQAPGADGKVKYLYKPVPCAPCPCECPDTRERMMAPRPITSAEPAGRPESDLEPPRPTAPPSPRPAQSGSSGGSGSSESSASRAPSSVGGTVTLRDRGGKDKADRSGVIVYIEQLPGKKFAALKKVRQMAQRDKSFVPGVVAITRGTTVDFPNEDKFYHNVFSLSEGNAFDLQLYRSGESKSVTFEKTGVVDVYCNIHPNMWGQILVLDNPFFTTTGKDGNFELSKVPPGNYTLVAWVSGGEPVRQPVKIEPGKRTEATFTVREGATSKEHTNKFNQKYERYK